MSENPLVGYAQKNVEAASTAVPSFNPSTQRKAIEAQNLSNWIHTVSASTEETNLLADTDEEQSFSETLKVSIV